MAAAHNQQSLVSREITLRYRATLGTSGAAPAASGIDINAGFGVLVSSGSGVYSLPLLRGGKKLLRMSAHVQQAAAYDATKAIRSKPTSAAEDNVAGATPSIGFTIVNSAGAATQPATSDILNVELVYLR